MWLVSKRYDLWMFGAPAAIALALVPLGRWIAPTGETPFPMWIVCVLIVDVAHVWSTIFRTYLDPAELKRRPVLYAGAPLVALVGSAVLCSISMAAFWTGLAYVAVFHFIRQQYGWVALYNRRDPNLEPIDRIVDNFVIYVSTLFPILWWHAHLPRSFSWFVPGDFFAGIIAPWLIDLLWPVYVASFFLFAWRQRTRRRWGKILVVGTTAACWGVGIVATNTDWAFTVTNVLIHGVPYFGIVWMRLERKWNLAAFLAIPIALAAVEELGWTQLVYERGLMIFVPLLALPQLTHYLLDGFIWKASYDGRRRT